MHVIKISHIQLIKFRVILPSMAGSPIHVKFHMLHAILHFHSGKLLPFGNDQGSTKDVMKRAMYRQKGMVPIRLFTMLNSGQNCYITFSARYRAENVLLYKQGSIHVFIYIQLSEQKIHDLKPNDELITVLETIQLCS